MGENLTRSAYLQHKREKKYSIIVLIVLLFLSLFLILLGFSVGRYNTSFADFFHVLFDRDFINTNQSSYNVIVNLRIPRTMCAFVVGGSLAVAGMIYQNTFNNPLVSPDVLGVSSGASVGAAAAILFSLSLFGITALSLLTGLVAVFITVMIPKLLRKTSNLSLVLSGIIVSAITNSIVGIIKYLADGKNDKLASITFWIMGGFSGVNYSHLFFISIVSVLCIIILIILRWRISIISTGEISAKMAGTNYKVVRVAVIICSTLLTASSVSICGCVSWVGLVIPHIIYLLQKDNKVLSLPSTFLLGGIFLIICDIFARTLSINEIPISIFTGIIGALIFTIVLFVRRTSIND